MPFVIPRVHVPHDVNDNRSHPHCTYDPKPLLEDLEKYEAWLCAELALVKEAIEVAKFGVSTPDHTTEKNNVPNA